jgi:putative ABC transport system permease protein
MTLDPQQVPPPRAEYARTWRRYLRFFGPRAVADLDDELRFHIEMRVRDYIAHGMSEADARAATVRRLGDLATTRDACVAIATRRERRMTRAQIVDALVQDLRFAGRTLRRQKGWTAVAVLTLALGIGANSAMFSVVNRLLLNPIPYPDADRVVVVRQQPSQGNNTGIMISITPMGRVVAAWREHARSFESIEPYMTTDVTLQRPGEPARVAHTASVLPTFARFAGERPLVGRMFTDAEAKGEANVVMLSEAMWRTQYGADESILGKTMTVNEKLATIIGVKPYELRLPRTIDGDVDLWLPLDLARRDDDGMFAVGRLRPGISRAAAAAELDAIARRDEVHGKNNARYAAQLARPSDLVRFQDTLVLLSVAVALVLIIACANVAHLLLARASTRQREMAIRAALGAGTERLFRQLLTESLILSGAGCIAGLVVGWTGLKLLVAARPESMGELAAATMDGTTLLVTAGLSVLTGIAFGLIGAVQASRHSTHDALKAGSLTSSSGRSHGRMRSLLVVTEMALSTMLLIGATLLLRSVMHLQSRDLGFDAHGLYSLDVHLPEERYQTPAARDAFFRELIERSGRLPGVAGVTVAASGPASSSFLIGELQLEGQPDPQPGSTAFIPYNGVEPEYFTLMGMRLVEGTTFTDTTTAAAQVIINQGMARKQWPGQSALGRRLRVVYNGEGQWKTVVGVASDALMKGLTHDASEPLLYTPGTGRFRPTLMMRTSGDARIIPTLAGLVSSIDSKLPPPGVSSVEDVMRKSIARPRFTMFLLTIFTMVAVGLAAVGLYGVLAYNVAQRTREIGIRIALGASRRRIARTVMSQGLVLAGVGAVIGLIAARSSVKLIGGMLYGVQQTDGISFVGGASALVAIAVLACLVPIRRALSVDPLIAMRAE